MRLTYIGPALRGHDHPAFEDLDARPLLPNRYLVEVGEDDGVEETITKGDVMVMDRSNSDPSSEGIFLQLVHGERRIKRVQRVAGGAWPLISDNPRYEKELIKPQDMKAVEILGRCEIRIGRVLSL